VPTIDHLSKRLRKKSKRGTRGWPGATIAFYGPDASRATKVVVSIIPTEGLEPSEMHDRQIVHGDAWQEPRDCSGDVGVYEEPRREVGRHD